MPDWCSFALYQSGFYYAASIPEKISTVQMGLAFPAPRAYTISK